MLENTGENAALGVPGISLDLLQSVCAEILFLFLHDTILCHLPSIKKKKKKKDGSSFITTQGRKMLGSHSCFHLAQFPLLPAGSEHFLSPWSWGTCQGACSIGPGNGEVRFRLSSYRCSQRLKNICIFETNIEFTLSCCP